MSSRTLKGNRFSLIALFKFSAPALVNNARPGWSMFDSIRAKNNSFFTIFCQYVLCVPAALYDGYELDMIKKITPTKPNIIRTLYFEAIKQGLSPDNPMDLQSPISERLLEICKNWNHN